MKRFVVTVGICLAILFLLDQVYFKNPAYASPDRVFKGLLDDSQPLHFFSEWEHVISLNLSQLPGT